MFRPKAVTPVRMEQLCLLWEYNDDDGKNPDTEFVQKFIPPVFQVENFTPSISPNFNS